MPQMTVSTGRALLAGQRGTAYYVDATYGNDANAGTSEATPWKTIAKVNATSFPPDAVVLFKKGEIWREALTSPVNIDSYGTKEIGYFTPYPLNWVRYMDTYFRWIVRIGADLHLFGEHSAAGPLWYIDHATTKTDGLSFESITGPLLALGGVGEFDERGQADPTVLYEAPTWKMWYDAITATSTWIGLGYATSVDGVTWTKSLSNPILSVGGVGEWDDDFVHHPCVIKVDSTYYLFYAGHTTGGGLGAKYKIGMATSSDGITWTKCPSNPLILPGTGASDPDFDQVRPSAPFYSAGMWNMLYWGSNTAAGTSAICRATSPDLISWTKRGPYYTGTMAGKEDKGCQACRVLDESGILRMWYTMRDAATESYGGYAFNRQDYPPNLAVINAPALKTGWTWTGDNAIGWFTPTSTGYRVADYIFGIKVTIGVSNVKAVSIRLYCYRPTTAHVKAAIYTFDGAHAGTLVAGSESDVLASTYALDWMILTIPGQPTLTAGASYWLCIWNDAPIYAFPSGGAGTISGFYKSVAYGAWPASFVTGSDITFTEPGIHLVTDTPTESIYTVAGVAADPAPLYQDMTQLTVHAGPTGLTAGTYYWDGAANLYIRLTDSSDPNVHNISFGRAMRTL